MKISRINELEELVLQCNLKLNDSKLVDRALTHPTFVFENKKLNLKHNQRLEFLGDAILGLIIGEYLYLIYPQKLEGELTKIRAAVVCEATLGKVAQKLNLGKYLRLGRGEELSGGRQRLSILADAFEAFLGAIYLENGLEITRDFTIRCLANEVNEAIKGKSTDYKTKLQEIVQKVYPENVSYMILDEYGPDHNKIFTAGITWKNKTIAQGIGKSKKEAEQDAAKKALKLFDNKG